jgi:uncharacterized protein (TIGR02757 family)
METVSTREFCDRAYALFHHPAYVSPDPLEVVREYQRLADREVIGLIASSLALGRVDGIVRAVRGVVARLRDGSASPADVVACESLSGLRVRCEGFRYRFFDAEQLYGLLLGIRSVLVRHGSIEACFGEGVTRLWPARDPSDVAVAGLGFLVDAVAGGSGGRLDRSILLAHPVRESACKRLMLYLRWLVRRDEIDPGGWQVVGPESLIIPVDTHVLRVARALGIATRSQATLSVAREITTAMRLLCPEDPVRYDFCLTRPGIHPMLDEAGWLAGRPAGGRFSRTA